MPRTFDIVAGARPNFVKIAPIMRAFADRWPDVTLRFVHTGQHYDPDMSDIFLGDLQLRAPDIYLDVGSAGHATQTGRVMIALESHLSSAMPNSSGVIVVGDVNSTMAAALTAVKLGIPVAHVEAGLRSFDKTMPEEINRIVTDSVSDVLLVSEPDGKKNLINEGHSPDSIEYVGNVMVDSLVQNLPRASWFRSHLTDELANAPFAVVTLHRPGNVEVRSRLTMIVETLNTLSRRLRIVLPLHPRTRSKLEEYGLHEICSRNAKFSLVTPVGYLEMLALLSRASVVLTDSGGIQEEATFLDVPCLTLRPSTERPVTVTHGTNSLIGDDIQSIETFFDKILHGNYKKARSIPGWDGSASHRIVRALKTKWMH